MEEVLLAKIRIEETEEVIGLACVDVDKATELCLFLFFCCLFIGRRFGDGLWVRTHWLDVYMFRLDGVPSDSIGGASRSRSRSRRQATLEHTAVVHLRRGRGSVATLTPSDSPSVTTASGSAEVPVATATATPAMHLSQRKKGTRRGSTLVSTGLGTRIPVGLGAAALQVGLASALAVRLECRSGR